MNNYSSYKLDLHGTFYRDVSTKVHRFISKCIMDKAQEVEAFEHTRESIFKLLILVFFDN